MANREIMTNRKWMERHLRSLSYIDAQIATVQQEAENYIRQEARKAKENLHDDLIIVRVDRKLEDDHWFMKLVADRRYHMERVTMFATAALVDMMHEHLNMQVEKYAAVIRT